MYVAHPVEEHKTGGQVAYGIVQIGLAVSHKCEGTAGGTGYCAGKIQDIHFRKRMILARTQGLSEVRATGD